MDDAKPRGLLFTRASLVCALGYLALGLVFGCLVMLLLTASGAVGWKERFLGSAARLVTWRVDLLGGLPQWVALFLSNAVSLLVVSYLGLLGCAAEVWLRRRSAVYARLCRATSRQESSLGFLNPRLRALRSGPGRDGVVVAYAAPVVFLLANGAVMGMVLVVYALDPARGIASFLACLAPHGVIEFPALCLAGSLGLTTADALADAAARGEDLERVALLRLRARAMTLSVAVLLALFLIAGYLEGTVTPLIAKRF